jgi:hypothetical protein
MIRTINIEDQKTDINSSAGWLYVYRNQFGHDILPDLMPVIESVIGAIASVLEESGGVFNEKTLAQAMNNDALVDAFIKMAGMQVLTIFNIFWAMAKNADKTIPGPEDYFNTFERFPVDVVVPELFYAIVDSSVSSKNATRLLQRIKTARTTEEQ